MEYLTELDYDHVKAFIEAQPEGTKVYVGSDSEKVKRNGVWYADFTVAIVVHISASKGCKIFGEVTRERDYDAKKNRPALRLMGEVYRVADVFTKLQEVLVDKDLEVHLDINPDKEHGSSCVVQQAVGFIKGTCNVTPLIKPEAFAASFAADRLKRVLEEQAAG